MTVEQLLRSFDEFTVIQDKLDEDVIPLESIHEFVANLPTNDLRAVASRIQKLKGQARDDTWATGVSIKKAAIKRREDMIAPVITLANGTVRIISFDHYALPVVTYSTPSKVGWRFRKDELYSLPFGLDLSILSWMYPLIPWDLLQRATVSSLQVTSHLKVLLYYSDIHKRAFWNRTIPIVTVENGIARLSLLSKADPFVRKNGSAVGMTMSAIKSLRYPFYESTAAKYLPTKFMGLIFKNATYPLIYNVRINGALSVPDAEPRSPDFDLDEQEVVYH